MVAHDRQLLQQCVDEYWLVKDGVVVKYLDGIDAYTAMLERSISERDSGDSKSSARDRRRERARSRASTASLRQSRKDLESRIAELSVKEQALNLKLANSDTYATASKDQVAAWLRGHAAMKRELAQLEAAWVEVESRLTDC